MQRVFQGLIPRIVEPGASFLGGWSLFLKWVEPCSLATKRWRFTNPFLPSLLLGEGGASDTESEAGDGEESTSGGPAHDASSTATVGSNPIYLSDQVTTIH